MITVRLDADIPADRQITLTLPPEVPAGRAEVFLLIASAETTPPAPPPPAPPSDKFEREWAAFRRLLPELLDTHRGTYVAIHDGSVVDTGPDQVEVAKRAYANYGNVPIYVGLVADQPARVVRIPHVKVAGRR